MGKAIYMPRGKAAEYSKYAVNFYNGCSADCEYCYCKQGPMGNLWSITPTIKKTLVDELTAIKIFEKEVDKNLAELREHGLFFNFNSDPFLRETIDLNTEAIKLCSSLDIPTKVLTKQVWWINDYGIPKDTAIGFTLTGRDDLEPGAATNLNRIVAMEYLHTQNYKIWASIEPIVNLVSSSWMIYRTKQWVSHYKIGTLSGKKYNELSLVAFVDYINDYIKHQSTATVYWKDSLLEQAGVDRKDLPEFCVGRDYRWWK